MRRRPGTGGLGIELRGRRSRPRRLPLAAAFAFALGPAFALVERPALADAPAKAEAEAVTLRADKAAIDLEAKTATFEGNVELRRGELVVKCPRVSARYAEFPEVTWARASGGVVAEIRGARLEAPGAELDAAKKSLVLTGGVKVTRAGSVLRADKATVDVATGRITFEGVRASIAPPKKP